MNIRSYISAVWAHFRSRVLRSLHMKFEFNWPSVFLGEDVWKCERTDLGRWTDAGLNVYYKLTDELSAQVS